MCSCVLCLSCAVAASDQQQPRVWLKRTVASVTSTGDDEVHAEAKRARYASAGEGASASAAAVACDLPVRPIDMLHAWRAIGSINDVIDPLATIVLKAESCIAASALGASSARLTDVETPLHPLLCDHQSDEEEE